MKFVALLLAMLSIGMSCGPARAPTLPAAPDPLEVIPADWLDLPDAPFVARVIKGKAVLVNRTRRWLNALSTGCVVQQGSSAHVVGMLFGHNIYDGSYGPGDLVEGPLGMVNNIDFYVADSAKVTAPDYAVKRCPAGSRIAVIAAAGDNQYHWNAEGTAWAR